MGYFCHLSKKSPKSVYFAHKACTLDSRNEEALLLKGRVLSDLKKLPEAINHFKEALSVAPHRYEVHKGLVDCYLGLSRQREAVNFATGCCKNLANSPRALTLYASGELSLHIKLGVRPCMCCDPQPTNVLNPYMESQHSFNTMRVFLFQFY